MKRFLSLGLVFLALLAVIGCGVKAGGTQAQATGTTAAAQKVIKVDPGTYPYTWYRVPQAAYDARVVWAYATPKEYQQVSRKKISKFAEAPMLKELVSAGKLPSVEKRLPEEPLVVNPYEEVGQYGGIVHLSCPNTNWVGDGLHLNNNEAPLRATVGLNLSDIRPRPNVPNVLKDWNLSKDNRSITLYMRKGMRWSDGEPFTADDIVFWYEDILLNKDITPAVDSRWVIGGEVWKLAKVDDYTIKIDFAAPFPWILYNLGTWGPEEMVAYPKHYLTQFHAKYADKAALDKLVKDGGFTNWWELFANKSLHCWAGTSFMPTLSPYILKDVTPTTLTMERNPYYWKVDTAGNQLPYFDGISAKVVADADVKESMTIAGEFDFAWGVSTPNYPMYQENKEKGNYKVLMYPYSNRAGGICVSVNQTYAKDKTLRGIFQDKRFRQALSVAIDRNEMNQVLYVGRGTPTVSGVLPVSVFYEEANAKAYIDFDAAKANELLDAMGLAWDAKHEFRKRPDGKKLAVVLEFAPVISEGADHAANAEMLAKYWKAVGVDVVLKSESTELRDARITGNEAQLSLNGGATTTDDNLVPAPHHYVLWHQWADAGYGPLWVQWKLTNGEQGEKPPEDLLQMTQNWEKILVTADEAERIRLGREIFRWNAENVLTIGLVGLLPGPEIVRNNMRNVPPTGLDGGVAGTALIDYYYPEQFYFKQPLFDTQQHF
jgi:peptide/nickel transport system substrate-binding protein